MAEAKQYYHEERLRILEMVEEGKITADEAAALIRALETSGQGIEYSPSERPKPKAKAKRLRVLVFEGDAQKPKVSVRLPLSLAKLGSKLFPKAARAKIEGLEVDLDEVLCHLTEEEEGNVIEVEDEAGKKRVKIFVE